MRILTDDMELAGDVLQEMTAALGLHELESSADFPLQACPSLHQTRVAGRLGASNPLTLRPGCRWKRSGQFCSRWTSSTRRASK